MYNQNNHKLVYIVGECAHMCTNTSTLVQALFDMFDGSVVVEGRGHHGQTYDAWLLWTIALYVTGMACSVVS